ncbi:AraC family transcriptional regulator, partial [bacterium]
MSDDPPSFLDDPAEAVWSVRAQRDTLRMDARDREDARLTEGLADLAAGVDRGVPPGETMVRRGAVWVSRVHAPTPPAAALYGPMLCVIAQGAKELLLGGESYVYETGDYLLNSVAVPASGRVLRATPARPALWTMIELDPALVSAVMLEMGSAPARAEPLRTVERSPIDAATLDPIARLVHLMARPEEFDFLASGLLREIVYRMLRGEQGARFRQIAATGGPSGPILRAVEWLRRHYTHPMSIEALARECGLSPSTLHHHFKAVTAMSPLQY